MILQDEENSVVLLRALKRHYNVGFLILRAEIEEPSLDIS